MTTADILRYSKLQLGVYRCVIEVDKSNTRFFKHNKKNAYTNIDIMHARELGLMITAVEDGGDTAMVYTGNARMKSRLLFNVVLQRLSKLRQKTHYSLCKQLMSTMWGVLCETNRRRVYSYNIPEGGTVVVPSLERVQPPNDAGHFVAEYVEQDKTFKLAYARFKPFVLAQGRHKISSYMRQALQPQQYDSIIRIHTDGVLLDATALPNDMQSRFHDIGKGLGQYKISHQNQSCQVIHLNRLLFKDLR